MLGAPKKCTLKHETNVYPGIVRVCARASMSVGCMSLRALGCVKAKLSGISSLPYHPYPCAIL